ncbi:hypothetical protein H8E88_16275 [candidate division KSB1 bacterium]|nr:hypothetical protein [candidate division KSB1 bacterium]
MKRLILINLICILSLFCLFQQAYCLPWPPDIDVYYIKFNYQSGQSSDALKIKNISAPEWANGGSTNKKIAYIKNQSSRKIKAKFWIDRSSIDWICVYADKISGTGIGDVPDWQIDFNGSQYSQEEQITCSGSVPGSVGKRNFTWRWYAFAIDDYELEEEIHIGDTSHEYYTLLAAPQSPMTEPWKEVLDYACDWAEYMSSSSSAMIKVVQHIYDDLGFEYDTIDGSSRYTDKTDGSFGLTSMLSEIPGSDIIVNCYDCGKAVKIFANALGCGASYNVSQPFGYLNCIKPIGKGWANNPFYSSQSSPYDQPIVGEDDAGRTYFGNHAFACFGYGIWDATLRVDTDSNPDAPPHSSTNGSWVLGWSWSTYKSKVVDDVPESSPASPTTYSFSVQ